MNPPVSKLHLDPGDGGEPLVHEVSQEFFVRQRPQVGGYLVVYADGYQAYSPAEPFEGGYRPLEEVDAEQSAQAQKASELETELTALRFTNTKQLEHITQLAASRDQLERVAKSRVDEAEQLTKRVAELEGVAKSRADRIVELEAAAKGKGK